MNIFLRLYDKHITPIANTYAWVLMGNHFHVLARIKSEKEVLEFNLEGYKNLQGLERVNKQFSNLFNGYAKGFNKRTKRTGSLFEHPFKRVPVHYKSQLLYLIYYIHYNPVHHGFCENESSQSWYLFQSFNTLEKFFYAFCE